MSDWLLCQFRQIVSSFLDGCSQEMKEVLERRAFRLQQTGNGFERPNTAPLMDGFHELRGRAARMQARLIFYFASGRRIIFVDAFYKQGDKITKKDLAKARKNKRLIEKEEERANVLSFIN